MEKQKAESQQEGAVVSPEALWCTLSSTDTFGEKTLPRKGSAHNLGWGFLLLWLHLDMSGGLWPRNICSCFWRRP